MKSACDQLVSLGNDRDSASTLSTVGFVGAGVGAVATVATFLLWQPETPDAATTRPAVYGTPLAGGGMLLGLSGAF